MDSPTAALLDHEQIITLAKEDPRHTYLTLPDVDVNAVLAEHYEPGPDGAAIRLTRTQLWDMECRKGKDPALYLGERFIQPGSATTFPSTRHGHYEDFVRVAKHRPWKAPDQWHTVIENVRLDHARQVAWFVGTSEFNPPATAANKGGAANKIHASKDVQPLFHVIHGVEGTEEDPMNTWAIVHLTEERDLSLVDMFAKMGQNPYLKPFVECYIREVMKIDLKRK